MPIDPIASTVAALTCAGAPVTLPSWPNARVTRHECDDSADGDLPDAPAPRVTPTRAELELLQVLAAGPCTASQLAQQLGIRSTTASVRLNRAREHGLVDRRRWGVWCAGAAEPIEG
jgi:hypothetical protein